MSMPAEDISVAEGLRRLQAGDAPGAVAILEQVVALNPGDGAAFQYLGVARTQTGDPSGGIAALQKAAELLPSSAGIWFNLGIALNRAERNDEARSALQRALTLDPGHAKARLALNALPAAPVVATTPVAPAAPVVPTMTPPTLIPPPPSYAPPTLGAPSPVLGQAAGYTQPGTYSPEVSTAYTGYTPPMPGGVAVRSLAPTASQRILRGLGWGIVYGQWWTLLNTFWFVVEGGLKAGFGAAVYIILSVIAFTFVGSITGLIAAAVDADTNVGAIIGVVAGMLLFAAEYFLMGSGPLGLINVFFWFFTGRFVGRNIAWKIQQPVGG